MPREYGTTPIPSLAVLASPENGGGITDSHSLIPEALYHAFSTHATLMGEDLPLNRKQHEMIATVVSVANSCFYWTESHAEFLRAITKDDALIAAIKSDYRQATLDPADRVMLDYAHKLTVSPVKVSRADIEALRAHGFDDTAILQINLIASWFNYINRVADGLGVGRE